MDRGCFGPKPRVYNFSAFWWRSYHMAVPTVHTSRALRHQQMYATASSQAMASAMDAAERGQWGCAAADARTALGDAERVLALRSSYTPAEWDRARALHEKVERNLVAIRETVRDFSARGMRRRECVGTVRRVDGRGRGGHSVNSEGHACATH